MSIKYIDLFAGVGGFHYGIDMCNKETQKESDKESRINLSNTNRELSTHWGSKSTFSCVYSNEYNKYANSVYKKHYERCDDRDIRTVKTSEIPDHDLLVGGFPCQAFSVAGKRRGFEDTRGTLFFEIARIAKQKQPRLLLLENVKGLLSHDSGNTFKTILRSLDELGYDCQWQVLNSKDFGVPQNRERVFIIGHLRGTSRPEVFPIRGSNSKNLKQIIAGGQGNRVYMDDGLSTTIASQAGGQGAKTGLYAIPDYIALTERRTEEAKRLRRLGFVKDTRNLKKLEPREDGLANTVTTGDVKNQSLTNGMKIRRLTPVECERLQGFPDNWTKYGHDNKEMSDTQRYKMMGNAVTTNVVTSIVRKLI